MGAASVYASKCNAYSRNRDRGLLSWTMDELTPRNSDPRPSGDVTDLHHLCRRAACAATKPEPRLLHPTGGNPELQPTRSAGHRPVWVALGLAGLAAIVYIHLTSGPHHVLTLHADADKLEHVFAFGAMMFWFGQLYRRGHERFLICLCTVLSGVVLEYMQYESGHYDPVEYGDMVADGVGAVLGWMLLRTRFSHAIEHLDRSVMRRMGSR